MESVSSPEGNAAAGVPRGRNRRQVLVHVGEYVNLLLGVGDDRVHGAGVAASDHGPHSGIYATVLGADGTIDGCAVGLRGVVLLLGVLEDLLDGLHRAAIAGENDLAFLELDLAAHFAEL